MTRAHPSYPVIFLTLLAAVIACGCMATGGEEEPADRISGNGTITYVDLEGGFYGITAGGGRYLPVNLPAEFKQDGLQVRFVADVLKDTVTLQQWGTPVEIVEIERNDIRGTLAANGTITYVDLEGGFYGLVTDNGRHYLPLDLNETWQVDGMNVTFVARVLENTVTLQQWGVPVEILAIDMAGNATFVAETGTVTYIDLEGGFYGIIADGGERYLPFGLEESYQVDGMRIAFVGELLRDTVTLQQWGIPVEIIAVPWSCEECGGMVGIADPAAVWCIEQGYTYETRKNPDGSEYGVCILENGTAVDAWELYRQNR